MSLKLDHQLCFALYRASKQVIQAYQPFLEPLHLTYTQYITMLVLWEEDHISVKQLGTRLTLDSGTLTPLLKKLEASGYVKRTRSKTDERQVIVSLTAQGKELQTKALEIPGRLAACINLPKERLMDLFQILQEIQANSSNEACFRLGE